MRPAGLSHDEQYPKPFQRASSKPRVASYRPHGESSSSPAPGCRRIPACRPTGASADCTRAPSPTSAADRAGAVGRHVRETSGHRLALPVPDRGQLPRRPPERRPLRHRPPEALHGQVTVVTQNVDGFHLLAGSCGTSSRCTAPCAACAASTAAACAGWKVTPASRSPACPHCGGILRPDVVLFGEHLPSQALHRFEAVLAQRAGPGHLGRHRQFLPLHRRAGPRRRRTRRSDHRDQPGWNPPERTRDRTPAHAGRRGAAGHSTPPATPGQRAGRGLRRANRRHHQRPATGHEQKGSPFGLPFVCRRCRDQWPRFFSLLIAAIWSQRSGQLGLSLAYPGQNPGSAWPLRRDAASRAFASSRS